jgi:hypothetical protein
MANRLTQTSAGSRPSVTLRDRNGNRIFQADPSGTTPFAYEIVP